MALKTIVILTDDIDGGDAERTVTFSLNGKTYEIDLNRTNLEALTAALEPFMKAARISGKRRSPKGGEQTEEMSDVRVWARANGHEVSDRGRIPKAVMEAYKERN